MNSQTPVTPQIALELALTAARGAGSIAREMREARKFDVRYKGQHDLVTTADLASEEFVIKTIRERFPEHAFLTEEHNPSIKNNADYQAPLWIIDPIDGTSNFAHGHPHFAVSIAFAIGGEVVAGVVHSPYYGETFTATKGGGARLNEQLITPSAATSVDEALIATGFPPGRRPNLARDLKRLSALLSRCRDMRRFGAASLDICWVACGRLDGYYESVKPWDMAAAALVARESGTRQGHLVDPDPASPIPATLNGDELLFATPAIFDDLKQTLLAA